MTAKLQPTDDARLDTTEQVVRLLRSAAQTLHTRGVRPEAAATALGDVEEAVRLIQHSRVALAAGEVPRQRTVVAPEPRPVPGEQVVLPMSGHCSLADA